MRFLALARVPLSGEIQITVRKEAVNIKLTEMSRKGPVYLPIFMPNSPPSCDDPMCTETPAVKPDTNCSLRNTLRPPMFRIPIIS